MEMVSLNKGVMSLGIPEGFQVLTSKDIRKMGRVRGKNEWAIRNEEMHLMSEVTWKRIPFFERSTPLETTLANGEKYIELSIKSYKKGTRFNRTIGGQEAQGFRYSYIAAGTDMTAEYILLKYANKFYSFSLMGQTDTFDDNYQLFVGMLDSVKFN